MRKSECKAAWLLMGNFSRFVPGAGLDGGSGIFVVGGVSFGSRAEAVVALRAGVGDGLGVDAVGAKPPGSFRFR